MSFEIRRFGVAAPVAQTPSPATAPSSGESPDAAMNPDRVTISTQAAEQQYPTVGEYVKKRFYDGADSALDGLHGAAELLMPPLLIGEIAGIKVSHKKAALDQIWNLPMDPQGHWRVEARQIDAQESAKARAEIRQLPIVHAVVGAHHSVRSAIKWVSDEVDGGLTAAGHALSKAGNAVLDGFVSTGVAVGKGLQSAGIAIQNESRAAGKAVRNAAHTVEAGVSQAYDSAAAGVHWIGVQAVEVPKAAARGVVEGIGSVGQDMVDFSKRTEPMLAPAQPEANS
jgi:hypothetical protein